MRAKRNKYAISRRAWREYCYLTRREWKAICEAAVKFYGEQPIKSSGLVLFPTGLIFHLAHPKCPGRIYGGQYILAPKRQLRHFLLARGFSLKRNQTRRHFQIGRTPTFLP